LHRVPSEKNVKKYVEVEVVSLCAHSSAKKQGKWDEQRSSVVVC